MADTVRRVKHRGRLFIPLAALLVGCGARDRTVNGGAAAPTELNTTTVPVTVLKPSAPLPPAAYGDDWEQAVRQAENPVLVAYGLPDDPASGSLLYLSFQRKLARCLVSNGYSFYQPVPLGDQEMSDSNTEALNEMPIELRQAFVEVQYTCTTEANKETLLAAALGLDVAGRDQNTENSAVAMSPDEIRASEIELILANRETIAKLVANLETD